MRILFAGWPIAREMDVLNVCIVGLLAYRIYRMETLFVGWLIACEMGVFKSFYTWFIAWESEISVLVGPFHMKWVYKLTQLSYGIK